MNATDAKPAGTAASKAATPAGPTEKPKKVEEIGGPWCITFEWVNGTALRVDLEQYH